MATQLYVSGPAGCWVGTGASNTFQYLGWSESGFRVTLTGMYEDVLVDFSGNMPADVGFMGEGITVSGVLKYYDEAVSQKMYSFFNPVNSSGIGKGPGYGGTNSVGSLMIAEGGTFPVLLYSPYSFKSQYNKEVPGFYIYNGILSDPYDQTLNIKPKAANVGFRGIPAFGSYSGSTFNPGTPPYNAYALYTSNIPAALPGGQIPAYS